MICVTILRKQNKSMRGLAHALALLLFTVGLAGQLRAETICTLIMGAATGAVILEEGTCDHRITPASTLKLPLAVIGLDAGILESAGSPVYA